MDELLRRWVEGWRLCRGLAPPVEYDGALAVVLGLPGRERELFALTDDPAVVDRLAATTVRDTWLTVTTQHGDDVAHRLADAGLEPFAEHKSLMSIDLRTHPQPSPSDEVALESRGPLEPAHGTAAGGDVLVEPQGALGHAGVPASDREVVRGVAAGGDARMEPREAMGRAGVLAPDREVVARGVAAGGDALVEPRGAMGRAGVLASDREVVVRGVVAGGEVVVESRGALEVVRVVGAHGGVAARGMVAVTGDVAVMHDIQTEPAYRRRGLGSVVMGVLSRRAVERGASTGLLMATADGEQLYRRLGWLREATMVTAKGSGAAGAVGGDLGAVLAGR
ncbi:GNAT family N-acetyltransferase [Kribbella sp. CA-247076]|uniref:GNAT family N-acetyltransferase n=1 Tax=Kribbella sp. CA-247076 TaxID=3239941 RepID=UPI003D8A6CE5